MLVLKSNALMVKL